MIMPLFIVILIAPMMVGLLSVDIHGERFSIREFLNLSNGTETTEEYVSEQVDPNISFAQEGEPINALIEFPEETQKTIDDLADNIATGVTFLLMRSNEFGVWLGVTFAPFHYGIALLLAFAVFPYWWMFIGGFFYILIKERKEIRNEIRQMRLERKKK